MGIFMLGFPLGILLCFLILGQMVKATGNWLLPFYIAAAPGILIALIILFVSKPIRGSNKILNEAKLEKPFKKALAIPNLLRAAFGTLIFGGLYDFFAKQMSMVSRIWSKRFGFASSILENPSPRLYVVNYVLNDCQNQGNSI